MNPHQLDKSLQLSHLYEAQALVTNLSCEIIFKSCTWLEWKAPATSAFLAPFRKNFTCPSSKPTINVPDWKAKAVTASSWIIYAEAILWQFLTFELWLEVGWKCVLKTWSHGSLERSDVSSGASPKTLNCTFSATSHQATPASEGASTIESMHFVFFLSIFRTEPSFKPTKTTRSAPHKHNGTPSRLVLKEGCTTPSFASAKLQKDKVPSELQLIILSSVTSKPISAEVCAHKKPGFSWKVR